MKYLFAILVGALIVGGALTFGIHHLFGYDTGYFFARFVAGPAGLIVSGFCFVVYDSLWPRK